MKIILLLFTGLLFFAPVSYSQQDTLKNCKEPTATVKKSETAVQCKGITQKGLRCKNMTKNANGYCHVHQSQAPENRTQKTTAKPARRSVSVQCSATTKKGTRCKNKTYSPNGRCHVHGGD